MGTNNQARRAAKAKQRAQQRAQQRARHRAHQQGSGAPGRGPGSWRDAEHPGTHDPLMTDAERAEVAWCHAAGIGIGRRLPSPGSGLATLTSLPRGVVLNAAERLVAEHIDLLWAHGWQPRELHRQARIGGRTKQMTRLLERAVAVACARVLASGVRLAPDWRGQAEEMAASAASLRSGWLAGLLDADGSEALAAYALIAEALPVLFDLPPLDVTIPPPGHDAVPGASRPATADPMLERVRALLAKAESTEFEAEATALTAKAQELITKHAIDAAALAGTAGPSPAEPSLIRVPVDPPYADAKSLLLQTVAQATRCRTAYSQSISSSTVVGYPDDLAAVELLFTSLLVQAQHALAGAGRAAPAGAQARSQSFRSAFLVAYAGRIGERLAEINDHLYSAAEAEQGSGAGSFVPVLRAQQDAIADFMSDRFGDLRQSQVRGGYNPAGWSSGRIAADQARLDAGDLAAPSADALDER